MIRVLRPKYAKKFIAYVERTEGMRFKKNPTFHLTRRKTKRRYQNYNRLTRVIEGDKVVKVSHPMVFLNRALHVKDPKYAKIGARVILHELRENLYAQNIAKISGRRAHKRSERRTKKDEAYINRLVRRGG